MEKFKIPLINCEVELILTWSKNCVLVDMTEANHPPDELEFKIADTKLYVPLVTLSKEIDIKVLEQTFFDLPVKNEEEAYEKIIEMSNSNDYTTGSLLDLTYF